VERPGPRNPAGRLRIYRHWRSRCFTAGEGISNEATTSVWNIRSLNWGTDIKCGFRSVAFEPIANVAEFVATQCCAAGFHGAGFARLWNTERLDTGLHAGHFATGLSPRRNAWIRGPAQLR
jgi:hypothetical protein